MTGLMRAVDGFSLQSSGARSGIKQRLATGSAATTRHTDNMDPTFDSDFIMHSASWTERKQLLDIKHTLLQSMESTNLTPQH